MADEKKPRLVPLPNQREGQGQRLTPSSDAAEERSRGRRGQLLKASFVLAVLLPTLLAAVYYMVVAADRYAAGAGFSVRGMDGGGMGGGDLLGSFTGLASNGSTNSDSYIILKFLKSRDLVEKVEDRLPFREIYSSPRADFLTQLDPSVDIEHVVDYWSNRIRTTFDSTSGIVTFEVEAFTPTDAEGVAQAVLDETKALINELSSQARRDAVAYAQSEVERAETRLRAALTALRTFRETERSIDPAGVAQMQMELIGNLEMQRSQVNARIAAIQGEVDQDSPSMRSLQRQEEALQQQIQRLRSGIAVNEDGSETALTSQLAAYETLEVERNFAQQAYASALGSLEQARVEADRQQRYLAIYSKPSQPQYPIYPERYLNILLVFAGAAVFWAIGALITVSVRDHLS